MVGIVVGSDSDLEVMSKCGKVLDGYGIGWEIGVMSAHRAGDVVRSYAQQAHSAACACSSPAPVPRRISPACSPR